jgi:hypothetical protein
LNAPDADAALAPSGRVQCILGRREIYQDAFRVRFGKKRVATKQKRHTV